MSSSEFGPLDRRTLAEKICHRLRQEILSGVLLPGQRLDERLLAERLQVSRTPLRQAIDLLVGDGLIHREAYQGNFVRSFDAKQVTELYMVRSTLEQLAVTLAVDRMTDSEIDSLRKLADECQRAADAGDSSALSAADQKFHAAIIEGSESQVLIDLLARLRNQIHAVRSLANEDLSIAKHSIDERFAIWMSMRDRDAAKAAALMAEHIDAVSTAIAEQLGREVVSEKGRQ